MLVKYKLNRQLLTFGRRQFEKIYPNKETILDDYLILSSKELIEMSFADG